MEKGKKRTLFIKMFGVVFLFVAMLSYYMTSSKADSTFIVLVSCDTNGAEEGGITKSNFESFEDGWNFARTLPTSEDYRATVSLLTDVTAVDGKFGTGEDFSEGYILVSSGSFITLNLNGKTIDRALTETRSNGYVIGVSGDLLLIDSVGTGKITGGKNTSDGGGIYVNNGSFTMNGGSIKGNTAAYGGGVVLKGESTFNLESGEISQNISTNSGGGVYFGSSSTVQINGGEITGNEALSSGAGIYATTSFTVSGDARIVDNTIGETEGNVYLSNGTFIEISSDLFSGTIGVTTRTAPKTDNPVVVTSGWGSSTGTILSDISYYTTVKTEGETPEMAICLPSVFVTFDENGAEEDGIVTRKFGSFEDAWNYTHDLSTSQDYRATVKLLDDVTAVDGSFGTGLGFDYGGILVSPGKYITIDLNGKTIDRALTETRSKGYVIRVSGNFLLIDSGSDGKITGGMNDSYVGGGIYVYYGSFTMDGGSISGNSAYFGGGIGIFDGSVTIESGKISENRAGADGGGIYLREGSNATCIMKGGLIDGNSAISSCGGGVLVHDTCTFQLDGGEITNNTVKRNLGGAVYLTENSTFIVNCNADIIDNNYSNGRSNVCLSNGAKITFLDNFTSGIIGVTTLTLPTKDNPVVITNGWGSSTGTIISDNSEYASSITSTDPKEKTISLPSVSVTFDENGAEENGVVTTNFTSFEEAWNYAVGLTTSENYRATVKLLDNVTAVEGIFGTGAGFYNGSISVPSGKYITLDLNDKTINRNLANAQADGSVVKVSGNLVLDDNGNSGKITGGKASIFGGGIYVDSTGSFKMEGGIIYDNRADYGGGVYSIGSFELTGGSITNNNALSYGGGIYLSFGTSSLLMTGGTISDNFSNIDGGGIYVRNNGLFTMTGGTISGNSVLDGKGAGLCSYSVPKINISGNAIINGNTMNENDSNIYLPLGVIINISDNDETTENDSFSGIIGVTTSALPTIDNPVVITNGWSSSTGTIISDNSEYVSSITSTDPKEKTISLPSVSVTFDENGAEENGVVTTNFASFEEAWNYAVGLTTSENYRATVKLLDNVTAVEGIFGTGDGFYNGSISVPSGKYITLDLNDKTIDRNLANAQMAGSVVRVSGNLVLDDSGNNGKITGGKTSFFGGGIFIDNAILTMNAGSICDNYSQNTGGGIYVKGSLIMNGGSISNNTAIHGGGVLIQSGSLFEMINGTISDNTADEEGGGVLADGTFIMKDGTIDGNSADHGSGVYAYSGTFVMSGGGIINNTASNSGGGLFSNSEIYLSGDAVINGNTTGGYADNIFLYLDILINISDNDETTVNDSFSGTVGVTILTDPGTDDPVVITNGWGSSTGTIISDNSEYVSSITSTNPKEKTISLPSVSVTFDENGAEENGVVTTNFASFEEAWNYAVGLTTSENYRATVKLLDNVTAVERKFGTGTGFSSGSILVPSGKYITLDLNGKTIDRKFNGIEAGGSVITIKGNFVLIDNGSNGKISGGKSAYGGGIYVDSTGSFKMEGGIIYANEADLGGGVYSIGSFELTGGSITNNNALSYGGGIYLTSDTSSLLMKGGTISVNSSNYDGGGIYVRNNGLFTMTGGTISGNSVLDGKGAGLCSYSVPKINISGNAIINGNTMNENDCNIYLPLRVIINISDNDETTENDSFSGTVGVTTSALPTGNNTIAITSGWGSSTGEIFADNPKGSVIKKEAEKVLALATITFNANYDDGETTKQVFTRNDETELNGNSFTRVGYTFTGWNTEANGEGTNYSDTETVSFAVDTMLYAIWEEKTTVSIETPIKTVDYSNETISFTIAGTHSGIGSFTISYKVDDEWITTGPRNAGSYDVKITRLEDDTYKAYEKEISNGLVIEAKEIDITVNDSEKTYGEENPTFGYSVTLIGEDTLSGTAAYHTIAEKYSDVDSYEVTVSGLSNDNYSITFVAGNLTVKAKEVDVTVNDSEKTYGEDNPTFDYSVTLIGEDTLSGTAAYYTTAEKYSDVGSYEVTVSGLSNDNYSITFVAGNLTVKAKDITVTADAKSSVHKEELVALTYSSDFELYDGDSFTGSLETTANKDTVGEYDITQGTLLASNYNISFVVAKYNVTAKNTITITETAQTFDYDSSEKIFAIVGSELTGFVVEYESEEGFTATAPISAGSYNVQVTRSEDLNNYGFSVLISDGIIINKQKVTKPSANDDIYIENGNDITYDITVDSRYYISGNVKDEVGNYVVTVALNDTDNYEWMDGTITNITFDFVIRQAQMVDQIGDASEGNDIIVTTEDGFDPNYTISITTVEEVNSTIVDSEINKKEEIITTYDVRLLIDGNETQPENTITLKILIPEKCKNKDFRILHIHGETVTEVSYTIEGDYAVINTDVLSMFIFVLDKEEISLVWLIVLLTILIIGEVILAVFKIRKEKANKGVIKAHSFTPLLLSTFIPQGQIAAVITLGSIVVLGGIYNLYLYLKKDQIVACAEGNEKTFGDNKEVVIKKESLITPLIETQPKADAETDVDQLSSDNDDEETEVITKIDKEKGLAILIRYRKSFTAKLIQSSDVTKAYYSDLKNEILSYNTTSRISWNYDSINKGRTKLAKFNIRGTTLYLYLALDPDDYLDTKYKIDKISSKKYEDTPCLYKISNDRRAKYAVELIAALAEKFGLQKGTMQNEDYCLPYEETEVLIEKDLIKELISEEKYEDYLLRQQRAEVNSKKRVFVSANEVNEILQDDVATILIETKKQEFIGKKEKGIINIDVISANFEANEIVNLESLKKKKLLPGKVNYFKVLARGTLNKPLEIEANEFSIEAVKMIILTDGKATKIISA